VLVLRQWRTTRRTGIVSSTAASSNGSGYECECEKPCRYSGRHCTSPVRWPLSSVRYSANPSLPIPWEVEICRRKRIVGKAASRGDCAVCGLRSECGPWTFTTNESSQYVSQNVLLTATRAGGNLTLRRWGEELQTWEHPAPPHLGYFLLTRFMPRSLPALAAQFSKPP
jgi:hypothetical protein